MRFVVGLALGTLWGCGGEPTAESCAAICEGAQVKVPEGAEPVAMSAFEKGLVDPILAEVRQGVRPFDDQGIGICRGEKSCEEYLGLDVGELPPGKYMVRANLAVPQAGPEGTWKVTFDTACTTSRTTEKGTNSSTSNYNRTYEVKATAPGKAYKLEPIRTFESPSENGARDCTYSITAHHPDGDKVFKGTWKVPDVVKAP